MKVMVLGGTGYVGARLCALLRESGWATPICAARRALPGGRSLQLDTRDPLQLREALRGVDAVVNCVAGSAAAIAEGARALAQAALDARCHRLVHLSSMAVYGPVEGVVRESAALDGSLGWYARAKCEAEAHVASFAAAGGAATVLRPGCVWGPGSALWVGRIAQWLEAGRLGDLGAAGDGWSNLVHVDDVCRAVLAALRRDLDSCAYNLAGPDSPRWNDFFVDLALAIGATPVRRVSERRLRLDAMLLGPPLKAAEILAGRLGLPARALPAPIPPNLPGLWQRQIKLDASCAQRELGLAWTPYPVALRQCAAWWLGQRSADGIAAAGAAE